MPPERRTSAASVRACICTALLLAGCAGAPPLPPAPAVEQPEGFPAARYEAGYDTGGTVYRIVPEASEIMLYVYRGGRLARFGHNHVISSRDVRGYAFVADAPARSRFDLYVPVQTLIIDDPVQRADAGEDFSSVPSQSDIEGTRRNMLGERLLQADQFPFVVVGGRIAGGPQGQPELEVDITVRGVTHRVTAPARIERKSTDMLVRGELRLLQTDLGLTPFTALGGALAVEDAFDLHYRITARRE